MSTPASESSATPKAAPEAAPKAVPAVDAKSQRPAVAERVRAFLQNVQSKLPKKKAATPAATSATASTEKPQPIPVGARVRAFLESQLKRKKAPAASVAAAAATPSETAAPPATETKPKPPPMSVRARAFVQSHWNWKKALIGMVGGVVLLGAAAWQFLPDLAKEMAEEEGSAILGRKVTIGAIEWDPLSMEFTLTDITIAGAPPPRNPNPKIATPMPKGGIQPQLHIKSVYINAEWESLLRLEPVLENITIESPHIRVTHRGKGAYDFDDILKNLSKWQNAHPSTPDAPPTPLALYNIVIHNGAIAFTDHLATGEVQQHRLNKLELGIPFFSNIATHRTVTVQPRLAFDLNGSHFETVATTTPSLSETAKTSAHFIISRFDVAQYAPYLPANLPIRPHSAVIDADIRLKFDAVEPDILESKVPSFTLSGTVNASNVALIDNQHQPLLTANHLVLAATEVRPMEQILKLQTLTLQAPTVYATRSKEGRINWNFAPKKGATNADAASTTAENNQKPWHIELAQLDMQQGSVRWTDAAPAAQLGVERWDMKAQSVQWPLTATPTPFQTALSIPAGNTNTAGQLTVKGQFSKQSAHASIHLRDGNLALGQPYLTPLIEPMLYGLVDADMDVKWAGVGLPTIAIPRGAIRHFALKLPHALPKDAKSSDVAAHDLPSWEVLDITGGEIHLNDHSASVRKLILRSPSLMAHRNAKKQWVALQWLKNKKLLNPPPAADTGISLDTAVAITQSVTQSVTESVTESVAHSVKAVKAMVSGASAPSLPASTPTSVVSKKSGGPWKFTLTELQVEQGHIRFDDRAPSPRGVRFELSDFSLKAHSVKPAGTEPMPLSVSARMKSSRTLDKVEPGYISYRGAVQWNPVVLQPKGEINLQAIPLHVFAPYLANRITFSTESADTTYKGTLELAITPDGAMRLKTAGDAALNGWNLQTLGKKGNYEDLLRWGTLQLPGIDLEISPDKITQLKLKSATLSDFYARVEINKEGQLNLQNLYRGPPIPPGQEPPESAPADITLGPIQVRNGTVAFSDSHIDPGYSANLTELQGKISQFASMPNASGIQLADITISGKAEGSALLEVTGKINPLTKPLVMNIRGKVRDLDLPTLNTYSEKHMGYAIENGKLSMDVEYEIQPNGDLVANNRLVLKQLALSEKDDDSITKLPLKLAMSLLSDRNGVVHMDLPISGNLTKPDFEITTVLWELFSNLIMKALTAPFTLLSKAFGGDDGSKTEWNSIYFAPGSSALHSTAMQALNQQIELLKARPKLNVMITGEAHFAAEKNALQKQELDNIVHKERQRRALRDESLNATLMTQEEYADLLRMVYRRSDIPKPRNWIGMEKDMPLKEVQDALLDSIVITEESMRELALQRGNAVKDYLLLRKLKPSQIFLQAPKTQNPETDWKPRVQLGIREATD